MSTSLVHQQEKYWNESLLEGGETKKDNEKPKKKKLPEEVTTIQGLGMILM